MARICFTFMEKKVQMTDEAIFHDTRNYKSNLKAYALNNSKLILALPLLKSL
jgi:hypothetical protein